jgi:hypothetical protein
MPQINQNQDKIIQNQVTSQNKGVADILFLLDTSTSMNNVFDFLIKNIEVFIQKLKIEVKAINQWDLRVGVVAGDRLEYFILPFNNNVKKISEGLKRIMEERKKANECILMGIDLALTELEWRKEARKILIVFTDEKLSTNHKPEVQRNGLQEIIKRLTEMKILLIFYSPECPDYKNIAIIPKSKIDFIISKNDLIERNKLENIFDALIKTLGASFYQNFQVPITARYKTKIYNENFKITNL